MTSKEELKKRFELTEEDFHGEVDDHIVIRKSGIRKIKEAIKIHTLETNLESYVQSDGRGHAVVRAMAGDDYYGVVRRFYALGEASPENNDFPYPVAVAEKRAEARVILKAAGVDRVISEIELDTIKQFTQESIKDRIEKAKQGTKR